MAEALRRPELREGFVAGAFVGGAVLVTAVAGAARGHRPRGWPMGGAAVVLASAAALALRDRLPDGALLVGLLLLGLAGLVPLPWRLAALAPGAVAVAVAVPSSLPAWATGVVVLGTVGAGVTGALVDSRHRPGVGPVLLAGTALGAWACVPDVEQAGVVAGSAAAVALLMLVAPLRLGSGGAPAAIGLVLWAAAAGAGGRPAALIGAAAGLGVLVVGAAALPRSPTRRAGIAAVAGQGLLVLVTSRGAGLRSSPLLAAGIASTALLVALITAGLVLRIGARSRRGRSSPIVPT